MERSEENMTLAAAGERAGASEAHEEELKELTEIRIESLF
jgi:hypothetical protein